MAFEGFYLSMRQPQTNDFHFEVNMMHDLNKTLFRVLIVFALFSFFMSAGNPVFSEENSAASKIVFHVA